MQDLKMDVGAKRVQNFVSVFPEKIRPLNLVVDCYWTAGILSD